MWTKEFLALEYFFKDKMNQLLCVSMNNPMLIKLLQKLFILLHISLGGECLRVAILKGRYKND